MKIAYNARYIVASAFAVAVLCAASAQTLLGQVKLISPPSSVQLGMLESDEFAHLFLEQPGLYTLSTNLTVYSNQRIYDSFEPPTSADQTILPAGTSVFAYMLHTDPIGNPPNGVSFQGTIRFPYQVLGVIFLDADLDATDNILGSASTAYPNGLRFRGVDFGPQDRDVISIHNDYFVTFQFMTFSAVDQVRILTAVPEPTSVFGLAAGIAGLLARRRRRGRSATPNRPAWSTRTLASIAMLGVTIAAATAQITTLGQVTLLSSPPANVAEGGLESDITAYLFKERTGVVNVAVDIAQPGHYDFTNAPTTAGAAGIINQRVDVYMLHADPVGIRQSPIYYSGTIKFPRRILGLIVLNGDPNSGVGLYGTDATLGASGTTYQPYGNPVFNRQLEFPNTPGRDTISYYHLPDNSGSYLTFHFRVGSATDQVRILLDAPQTVAEPASLLALSAGVGLVAGSRHRRRSRR